MYVNKETIKKETSAWWEKFCWGGGGTEHNLPKWKLVGRRCTRWFFRDVKLSLPYRESTGVQNSTNIFGKWRSTFLKYKTMKREIKWTHLSSKRSMKNDYFDACPNMSIILCMSSCIVLFAYFLSMLITAILLSRSCPIVRGREGRSKNRKTAQKYANRIEFFPE